MQLQPFEEPILGLDLSLNGTGWAVYLPYSQSVFNIDTGRFETPKTLRAGKEIERLMFLREQLELLLLKYSLKNRAHAFIEEYAFAGNGGFDIGEWGGTAKLTLAQAGIHQYGVAPSSLKKFVTGKGTAKKEEMLLHLYKRWGREFASNDEGDAFGLVMAGLTHLNEKNTVPAINSLYRAPDAGRIPATRQRVLRISPEN